MHDLISVVVPVYNVEKYLLKCFESISKQTYTNLEIILVDDGSKDTSGKMCDDLKLLDYRVIVVHKKNAGLGYARNTGLEMASGKYVLFVDSDDYIEENMVSRLYQRIVKYGVDTSFCGYSIFFEDEKTIKKCSYYADSIFEEEDVVEKVLLEMIAGLPNAKVDAIIPMSVWHALYSMDIIRDYSIRFPSEREYMSEDIVFDIAYLQHSNKVSYVSDALYNYRQISSGSLTHVFRSDEFDRQKLMYLKINAELCTFFHKSKYELRTMRYFLGRVRTCVDKAVSANEFDPSFNPISYVKHIFGDEMVRRIINVYPYKKNPLKIRLFNACIRYRLAHAAIWLTKLRRSRGNNRF